MRPTTQHRLSRQVTPLAVEPPADPLAPERALLWAILDRAVKDAQSRSRTAPHYRAEARAWLRSPQGEAWCTLLGLRYAAVEAWLTQGEAAAAAE